MTLSCENTIIKETDKGIGLTEAREVGRIYIGHIIVIKDPAIAVRSQIQRHWRYGRSSVDGNGDGF